MSLPESLRRAAEVPAGQPDRLRRIAEACVAAGLGQGDQHRIAAEHRISRAEADEVVALAEDMYVAAHRVAWRNATPDRPLRSRRRAK